MSTITTSTGLVSGLNIGDIVDALINAERSPIARMESRLKNVQTVQAGLGQLQAQLLSLSTSVLKLSDRNTFSSLTVQNSDPSQLSVVSTSNSISGSYQFQSVRLANNHRTVSRGFANGDAQQIGTAGQLVIASQANLDRSAKLDVLNGGQGVRRGTLRITDRSGTTTDVDLRNAVTVADVVSSINSQALGVRAEADGDRLKLTDLTGATANNLSIADLGGGQAAADLGIAQSVAATSVTGSQIFTVTDQFTLNLLNDGNGLRQTTGSDDLSFSLADGTTLAVNLDGAATIADVIQKITNDADNNGKLTAALTNGRLVLTDTTSGGGTFAATNLNGSNAVAVFGLDTTATTGVLTGRKLSGGIDSVLLRNLRGGRGIATPGEITLTDRTGATATVDLSAAETLDDVLRAINTAATSPGNVALKLRAELDAEGSGIVIRDTSGSTASNLKIADVGAGTTAANLGIALDSATNSVGSGRLRLRRVNEATSLSAYSPRGTAVTNGSFRIEDSAGNQAVVSITSNVKTIGDVLDRINAATGINITAQLNETGDGIVLVDDAAGAGTLKVTEVGGRTGGDLRLLGASTVGGDGKQRVSGRQALIVDVAATDTLNTISGKINTLGGTVRSAVVDTGAALNGFRLSLSSTIGGNAGRFTVEDGSLNLGFTDQEVGRDAVLRIGADPASAFLKTSSGNTFTGAVAGLDVTLLQTGTAPATVTTAADTAKVQSALQGFVTAYNAYIDLSAQLTKYDTATQTRAALQGTSAPLLVQTRFNTLINRVTGPVDNEVRSLADAGVKLTTGGKLELDTNRLAEALLEHPDQVRTLFTDLQNGFGTQFDKALDSFTDSVTGSLTAQFNALQTTADTLSERIVQLDDLLAIHRTRLEQQFASMEAALSGLQSQQSSLGALSNIIANLRSSSSS